MAKPLIGPIAVALVAASAALPAAPAALAQTSTVTPPKVQVAPLDIAALGKVANQLSNDCRVSSTVYEAKAALRNVRKVLRERRPVKVLSVGPSGRSGAESATPAANYPSRLEKTLEGFLQGIDFEVVARTTSGEVSSGATERMKLDVAELKPDLVVWQVGNNDVMARIGDDEFGDRLRSTLRWFKYHSVDVVLIDPQYVERLASNVYYRKIITTITSIARQEHALLVHRYDTMAEIAQKSAKGANVGPDNFQLANLSYTCVAEYAARAIIAGVVEAEQESQNRAAPGTKK